jgi:hypothetical protein
MKFVKLDDIRIDGGTQFRDQINQDVVKDYAEKMREGENFPPLDTVFDGVTHWLVDGFHRYFASHDLGFKEVQINYKPGTQEEAQLLAMGVNAGHGLQRNNATKRKVVEAALAHPSLQGASNVHIAKLCKVSDTFVAAVRNPEMKKKQAEKVAKHYKEKLGSTEVGDVVVNVPQVGSTEPTPVDGSEPDAAELLANELAIQADMEAMNKFLEADDKLAHLEAENKRLRHLNAKLEMRMNALMTEKNEAIKDAKAAQAKLDKIQKAKK